MPWDHPHIPNQGKSDEWWTPKYIFDKIDLQFDLDPCMPEQKISYIPVKQSYDFVDDGLLKEWFGRVWMNPPYGRETGKWMEKLAKHGNGIALVFSRTDVKWWHSTVSNATAICFVRGRITFISGAGQSAPGNSGGPSALIAYGKDNADAIRSSGLGMTLWV